jgi:multicomponent Na+:H+ antiporter subunit B
VTVRLRLALATGAALALAPAVLQVARHMPPFGTIAHPYGDAVNTIAPAERHVTNMVTAVNFDLRGFDTLGEEFMLLCAVTGATVLLRGARGEQRSARPGRVPGRRIPPRSEAVTLLARAAAPLILLFGLYVALHATVTPGGGFQGGVIVASGLLLLFPGEGYRGWRGMVRSRALEAAEGGGAALYAVAGLASLATGAPYLANVLPLGELRDVFSGGLMLVENAGVAFAVAGGFAALFLEFLEETRVVREGEG